MGGFTYMNSVSINNINTDIVKSIDFGINKSLIYYYWNNSKQK